MINSMERAAKISAFTQCNKQDDCFNAGSKCNKCILSNETEGWLALDHYEALRPVGAVIDGVDYPRLSGWYLSKQYGLVSRDTYIGTNGDPVYILGEGPYYKVVLPEDKEVYVYPAI